MLGAGPGPAAAAPAKAIATPVAARPAPAGDHMNMGSMAPAATDMHGGGTGAAMPMDGMQEGANPNASFSERLVSWLGRLHTMVIHFPIALFIAAFGVEMFGLWWRRDYSQATQVLLVVGALGAVAAASLGWFAGGFYLSDRNWILMTHRWLGTAIAAFGIGLAYLATRRRDDPAGSRTQYRALLGLMALAISVQGFLGGTFMHGGLKHLAF